MNFNLNCAKYAALGVQIQKSQNCNAKPSVQTWHINAKLTETNRHLEWARVGTDWLPSTFKQHPSCNYIISSRIHSADIWKIEASNNNLQVGLHSTIHSKLVSGSAPFAACSWNYGNFKEVSVRPPVISYPRSQSIHIPPWNGDGPLVS